MRTTPRKRVVVKVGTNTLTDADGQLDLAYLSRLTRQIAELSQSGTGVALVTSGSVRLGMARLGLGQLRSLRESQAAAAVGQGLLMHTYHELFKNHDCASAQVLLIADDFQNRRRYLNARNTLLTLFEKNVIPVINENDTVSAEEIKFGDNDNLAAQVAGLVNAHTLIFLSDVDGLHDISDGKLGARIPVVRKLTAEIVAMAGGAASAHSRGGMSSKVSGARSATEGGAHVYIANGREPDILTRLLQGDDVGTHFLPQSEGREGRKRWIGMSSKPAGAVMVDAGALKALLREQKSLLAVGIVGVSGTFQAGDPVSICDAHGDEIGRGLSNYSSAEIERIKGIHSRLLPQILGYQGDPEVIHRDNLFTYRGKSEQGDAGK